jgi:hypothetical protein
MMARHRHEATIKMLDSTWGGEFDKALGRVISAHRGMNFFTDEQIAEIRAEMLRQEWDRRRRNRRHREQAQAIRAKQEAA